MNVHVQFYAQLRDLAGASELIYEEMPALRSRDKSLLIGAGVEFVDRNHELKPGDEISIMPPVQGG